MTDTSGTNPELASLQNSTASPRPSSGKSMIPQVIKEMTIKHTMPAQPPMPQDPMKQKQMRAIQFLKSHPGIRA